MRNIASIACQSFSRLMRYLFALLLFFTVMVLVHEAGHVMAIKHSSPASAAVFVWPGYQLYPDIGAPYPEQWKQGAIAATSITAFNFPDVLGGPAAQGQQYQFELERFKLAEPFIQLMGSGSTLLLAVLCLLTLTLLRPEGAWRHALIGGALLHLDLLLYAVLPTLFGVRHLVFLGSSSPEPVLALQALGWPLAGAIGGSAALSLLLFFWLYWLRVRQPLVTGSKLWHGPATKQSGQVSDIGLLDPFKCKSID